jgi:hypothetical protein
MDVRSAAASPACSSSRSCLPLRARSPPPRPRQRWPGSRPSTAACRSTPRADRCANGRKSYRRNQGNGRDDVPRSY